MKIGLYGGSFDPIHLGHLLVAVEELGLDRLFFIPAAQSPFKVDSQHAPAAARLQFLRLALAGQTDCDVDDQEIRRGGVSFSIDTLRAYAGRFPQAELFYLIGADNAAKLRLWREPAELARLAEFVVVPRPGGAAAHFPPPFRGRTLSVTAAEFAAMQELILSGGQPVSRERLCEVALRRPWRPEDRSIDQLIFNLRRKLGDGEAGLRMIQSVRGAGYILAVEQPVGAL